MDNSISFNGRIRIRDYVAHTDKIFQTSEKQDNIIREAAANIVPIDTIRPLQNSNVKAFHQLLESITGIKIPFINNEKGMYRTDTDIVYADRFVKPWTGMHVNIYF